MRYVLAPADCGPAHDPLVQQIVAGLAHHGVPTTYIDEPRVGGLADDAIRERLAVHAGPDVVLGGISRGARLALQVSDDTPCAGLVLWSFPFHPRQQPGGRERARWLAQCAHPVLLIQGTRDAMGNREQVRGYRLPAHIHVHWVHDGNHALVPRARTGVSASQAIARACEVAAAWIHDRS